MDGARGGLAACIAAALRAAVGRRVRLDIPSTDELAAAIARIGEPLLLVLDDLHELADTKAMVELEQLLLAAPENLTVLIGTRVMLPINLARSELPRLRRTCMFDVLTAARCDALLAGADGRRLLDEGGADWVELISVAGRRRPGRRGRSRAGSCAARAAW